MIIISLFNRILTQVWTLTAFLLKNLGAVGTKCSRKQERKAQRVHHEFKNLEFKKLPQFKNIEFKNFGFKKVKFLLEFPVCRSPSPLPSPLLLAPAPQFWGFFWVFLQPPWAQAMEGWGQPWHRRFCRICHRTDTGAPGWAHKARAVIQCSISPRLSGDFSPLIDRN